MDALIAWVIAPAILLGIAYGLGALLQRLVGVELPRALLAPLGAALALVLALTGYVIGLRGVLTPAVIVALALAGWATAVRAPDGLPRPGPAALLWAAVYALYMGPIVLSGHWTWSGYNFVNDTSIQLLLADWLPEHGREPAERFAVSTPLDALSSYIQTGYPLGSHSLLAAVHQLVPVRMEATYQPFIASFAGLAAVALAVLARPLVGHVWAIFAGFAAVAANLLYQYALQGNMKEIVTAAMLATTAALAGWSLNALHQAERAERPRLLTRAALLLAVPAGAVICTLSTAGGPYVALIVAGWLAMMFGYRLVPGARALATALTAGAVALAACSAATLSTLATFGEVTSGTYAAEETLDDLGHLVRPLELRQTAGVWLNGDYRLPPIGLEATLTEAGAWLVVALATVAIGYLARRRSASILLFSVPLVVIMLLVTPRVSPYADAKTYMLMTPGVVLLAALGAAAAGRLRPLLGAGLGAVLLGSVLASNALAYHSVQLAPIDRMEALRDLNREFAGQGRILFNEPEEFAKNFLIDTKLNAVAEAVTPKQAQLRRQPFAAYLWFDLDEQQLAFVQEHPLIVQRRSPIASRPPANYRHVYANEYYEAWRRTEAPRVLEHLSLQEIHRPALAPSCQDVRDMAARAAPGERLLAAPAPELVQLDTVNSERSPGWRPHPFRIGMVVTGTPGEAWAQVWFRESGTYRAWIAGSFGRAVEGYLDGRLIGAAQGVNTVSQWHDIGTVEVEAGAHELRLRREGGSLAPGDGFSGELGPLALQSVDPPPLVSVAPKDAARRLCGREWDWIERVEGA